LPGYFGGINGYGVPGGISGLLKGGKLYVTGVPEVVTSPEFTSPPRRVFPGGRRYAKIYIANVVGRTQEAPNIVREGFTARYSYPTVSEGIRLYR